jgi:hypothetical protein
MGYKNYEYTIGEGTDDAAIVTITRETITTKATEAVRDAKDEMSFSLGKTFRESTIERYGEMFRCWEAVNFSDDLAENVDAEMAANDKARRDYAWFLATSVTPVYMDALRRGEDGESAVESAERLAEHISGSFDAYLLG